MDPTEDLAAGSSYTVTFPKIKLPAMASPTDI